MDELVWIRENRFNDLPLEIVYEIMDNMDHKSVNAFVNAYPRYRVLVYLWKRHHRKRVYREVNGVFCWRSTYV